MPLGRADRKRTGGSLQLSRAVIAGERFGDPRGGGRLPGPVDSR